MNERRNFYRKKVSSVGYLKKRSNTEVEFNVRDLSLDGLRVQFKDDQDLQVDDFVYIRLPELEMEGNATVTRISRSRSGAYYEVGLQFATLSNVNEYIHHFQIAEEDPEFSDL